MKTIYPTITDKVAVVTGGAKGIGEAIVRRLSDDGYAVFFSYRNSRLEAEYLLSELQSAGRNVKACYADLSTEEGAKILRDEAIDTFGKIDVLVNNAGSACYQILPKTPYGEVERVLSDNLKSVINVSKTFYDDFCFSRHGSIVNVSSLWGLCGSSTETVYSAAKAGVIGFTRALAKELAPSSVRVNAVAPGAIRTDMMSRFSNEEIDEVCREVPLARLGEPSEVASVVAFLAGDDSKYVTGEVIKVSGGW